VPASDDAFDRAVQREQVLRDRAELFDSPVRFIRLVQRFEAALLLVWGLVLALHWVFWSNPRWLVTLHTIVFALAAVYALASTAFLAFVRRRRPDFFDED